MLQATYEGVINDQDFSDHFDLLTKIGDSSLNVRGAHWSEQRGGQTVIQVSYSDNAPSDQIIDGLENLVSDLPYDDLPPVRENFTLQPVES